MSTGWSLFVILLTVGNIVGCLWLLQHFSRRREGDGGAGETTHVWDGDLREYNHPLPYWWLVLFWLSAVFGAAYLLAYPGLGSFQGVLGWSQQGQYETEVDTAERKYGAIFAGYAAMPLEELMADPEARRAGRSLYLNHCAVCHGADARGSRGFPNLTDDAWLWGGSPDAILATLRQGRTGVMPALGPALGEEGVEEVLAHIRTLGGAAADAAVAEAGRARFLALCSGCHGPEGRGNPLLGAPDLTDDDWLHGATDADVRDVLARGRTSVMPAQLEALGEDRLYTLAAWLLGLREPQVADAGAAL